MIKIKNIKTDEAEFFRQDLVKIGRSNGNDLILTDESVSRFHCEIVKERDHYLIKNKSSVNGIIINDQIIDESFLIDGDKFQIGNTELVFFEESILDKTVELDLTKFKLKNTVNRRNLFLLVFINLILVVYQTLIQHGVFVLKEAFFNFMFSFALIGVVCIINEVMFLLKNIKRSFVQNIFKCLLITNFILFQSFFIELLVLIWNFEVFWNSLYFIIVLFFILREYDSLFKKNYIKIYKDLLGICLAAVITLLVLVSVRSHLDIYKKTFSMNYDLSLFEIKKISYRDNMNDLLDKLNSTDKKIKEKREKLLVKIEESKN